MNQQTRSPDATRAFTLGQLVETPGALEALRSCGQIESEFLDRHRKGDWGTVDAADAQANDDALIRGGRLFSSYRLNDGNKIWIITEADRSSTCVLLPDEY